VLFNVYFKSSACFIDVTSATVTWNIIHTLLGISNQSSFYQCSMNCMCIFENGSDIEAVSNMSGFLEETLNIWEPG
jgi:hypothetical protein